MINKLSAYHVHCKRYSKPAADRKFGFTKGGFGFLRPGERIDIDEKRVDLMTLLEYANVWETLLDEEKNLVRRIRLWVVVAIDIATRYILAMRFCTKPNAKTTLDVIRMMMEDKREMSEYVGALAPWIARCRPEMIYTDNGSGLVNDEVAEVLVECEIEHTRPEAGQPQARGHIESSFRGHNRIVRHFQGRTFKDILEKGDYDPVKTASLPVDESERNYVRAILDIYHNTPHEGLGGETPHNAWVRQTQLYKMRPLIEPDVMRHILGMDDTRTLDGEGLRFMGVQYHSPILAQWLLDEGQVEVAVRIDMGDMTSIPFQKDGMWYIADNQIGLLPGISVPEWMTAWKMVGEKFSKSSAVNIDVFYAALRELRENGEAAALRNPLGIRHMTIEKVRDHERALLHRAGFTVLPATNTPLPLDPPVARKSAFVSSNAPGFTDIVGETAAQAAAEAKEKAQSARKPKNGGKGLSSIGSADDIAF
ncbi:DDE-type integrase/transposase/recombinase [Ensifer aridi]|uniref:DDE-type integrase/transposase/recombinase n=1 Tax=Ensifer aridi TaxID=1708715 RepID=UPI001124DBB9|nr:DDE-type integrase/transposase/recombinase [Ensifer aridi]